MRYIFTSGDPDNGIGFGDTYNYLGTALEDSRITWTLTGVPGEPETYTIRSHHHGLYMDGDDSDEFNYQFDDRYEDTIVTRPAQDNDSQKWIVRQRENGNFTIQEKANLYFMSNHFFRQKTVEEDDGYVEWIATPVAP